VNVAPEQVIAFRVAAQGLAERRGDAVDVAASWTIQDSPPGAAALALHARAADFAPGALEAALEARELVALPNPRTAVAILPAGDVAAYVTSMRPPDEAALRAVFATALPKTGIEPEYARERSVSAISEALDGRVLSRDDLHEQLRGRLPAELLPWCEPCGSHHARRGVLSVGALAGRLCMAGRAGRQPAFARADQWVALDEVDGEEAGAELVRRFLHAFGPSTPAGLGAWAAIAKAHARRLWDSVADEMVEVRVDGRPKAWALAADADALADPAPAHGVRLIPAGDPLLQARDRELLIADEGARKRLWRAIGSPGLALVGGRPAASWRARKQGRRLAIELEPLSPLGRAARAAISGEAEAVAAHRGASGVAIA
jgi:winged helix DNA-binding protein